MDQRTYYSLFQLNSHVLIARVKEPLLTAVAVTIRVRLLALDTYVLRKAAIVRVLVRVVQKVDVVMVVNAVPK